MRLPIGPRTLLAVLHDTFAAAIAWSAAFWLRFNLDIPALYLSVMWQTALLAVPAQILIFVGFGLYRGIWRYASLPDVKRILFAVATVAVASPALLLIAGETVNVPRSVFLLDPLILVAIMGGTRLGYRAWKEHRLFGNAQFRGEPVLVVGAGDAAVNLLRETARSADWRVVGLLDNDQANVGRFLQGVRVLGPIDEIGVWATRLQVKHAIIAMPSASAVVRRRVVEKASQEGLAVLTVPSFDDLLSGKVTVSQIRKVEVEDLLGREQVLLDDAGLHSFLKGRPVMVTGAGGSIGSELCRQVARFQPSLLVLYEQNEFALYQLAEEFAAMLPSVTLARVIGDVKNAARLSQAMERYRPTALFHAAAYKHVPLMEEDNAFEAAMNNVLGTWRTAEAAVSAGIEKFVLVSTDKAVNPTNVMGATKRLAELVCQSFSPGRTKFVTVRFGNVLGSTGSVIPKFRDQIAKGGPLTVTHPEIERYFMSIPEAAQLVLQAGMMGKGGEIFVLDMGEPVKILDLARAMIRLSGFTEQDIRIEFTGLRPGEKLFEEPLSDAESTLPTPHPKLRVAKATGGLPAAALPELRSWLESHPLPATEEVREMLATFIPEYQSTSPRRVKSTA